MWNFDAQATEVLYGFQDQVGTEALVGVLPSKYDVHPTMIAGG